MTGQWINVRYKITSVTSLNKNKNIKETYNMKIIDYKLKAQCCEIDAKQAERMLLSEHEKLKAARTMLDEAIGWISQLSETIIGL